MAVSEHIHSVSKVIGAGFSHLHVLYIDADNTINGISLEGFCYPFGCPKKCDYNSRLEKSPELKQAFNLFKMFIPVFRERCNPKGWHQELVSSGTRQSGPSIGPYSTPETHLSSSMGSSAEQISWDSFLYRQWRPSKGAHPCEVPVLPGRHYGLNLGPSACIVDMEL